MVMQLVWSQATQGCCTGTVMPGKMEHRWVTEVNMTLLLLLLLLLH
jgi:hypothetical protein